MLCWLHVSLEKIAYLCHILYRFWGSIHHLTFYLLRVWAGGVTTSNFSLPGTSQGFYVSLFTPIVLVPLDYW